MDRHEHNLETLVRVGHGLDTKLALQMSDPVKAMVVGNDTFVGAFIRAEAMT